MQVKPLTWGVCGTGRSGRGTAVSDPTVQYSKNGYNELSPAGVHIYQNFEQRTVFCTHTSVQPV